MAAITKASFKKPQQQNRASIVWFLAIFLCVATGGNLMMNRPSPEDIKNTFKEMTPQRDGAPSDSAASSIQMPNVKADGGDALDSNTPRGIGRVSPFKNPGGGKEVFIYHHTLTGQRGLEGSVVLDMMIAHAYTFHAGGTYGGSCGAGNDVGRDPENSLIQSIGLQNELRFECPSDVVSDARKKVVPTKNYEQDGVRAFTPEYVELLKSVTVYPVKTEEDKFTIVVHMARGRATPCVKEHLGFDPYLPNKHFQTLIDKYMKPNARVIIYSQQDSFESFEEFRNKGYELHIEEPIGDVWKSILLADVVIMSRSSFSYAPAVVSKGTVVYTPFWHTPLRGWNIVGKDVLNETEKEFQRLKSTCKPQTDKWEKFRKKKKNQ
jgi:hypothetical protein